MLGSTGNHYLRFSISPACSDGLTVRKAFQDALLQSFGLTAANIYVDILWLAGNGAEVVARITAR
ncbi:hypothetical protein PHLGIDRAFT_78213 [Phlebiopsis gigantea 11061_1 CR5-6]|uniref:Uncharacterized protein n=1 Tax=Phlebiopsis gigantea (strain 11061_1 CR5-6) TaxID=745531 RepID=A0A0C3NEH9_PHLG1|nr:hypothetical protein PHLGIDRAFT_78213 [Phlebiopsis gigantea 11061_1 CR5-6]